MNNLFLFAIIAVIVVRGIARIRAAAKRRPGPPARPEEMESERTRRVQEEIARKIAARRGAAPRPLVDRAAARQAPPPPRIPSPRMVAFPEAAPAPLSDIDLVLAEQRKLADEVRALEAQTPTARGFGFAPLAPPVAKRAGISLPELADPQGAQRAIVLREILGAPRGLSLEGCLWR